MTARIVDIVGIGIEDRGCSCEEHTICGTVLQPDMLIWLLKEEIMVDGHIETAISVYCVTDYVEHCQVGFLPRFMICNVNSFNGLLAQVTDVFDKYASSPEIRKKVHHNHEFCRAVILDPKNCLSYSMGLIIGFNDACQRHH